MSSIKGKRNHNRMSHREVFGISLKKAWWSCGAASALMEEILAKKLQTYDAGN